MGIHKKTTKLLTLFKCNTHILVHNTFSVKLSQIVYIQHSFISFVRVLHYSNVQMHSNGKLYRYKTGSKTKFTDTHTHSPHTLFT